MPNKNDTRSMFLNISHWKLMLSLSTLAIISSVVVELFNLMDVIFVGQMISNNGMFFDSLFTDIIVFVIVIWMMCSEFNSMGKLSKDMV